MTGGGGGVDVVPHAVTRRAAARSGRPVRICETTSEIMTRSSREIPPEASRTSRPAQALEPGLYLVATPIGNLRDITLRALDTLKSADRILAEDTRVSKRLLDAYDISAKLQPYHDHNGEKVRPGILAALAEGAAIALVSDAGTPAVSDPGYKLVREAVAAGINVYALPGASAALAALCISGLPTDSFTFAGFPPPKTQARETWLETYKSLPGSLILFEGASRLADCLASLAKVLGERDAAVCRELTKMHEEARRGSLASLAEHYAEAGPPRGEIVIIIGPATQTSWDEMQVDEAIRSALQDMRVKDAAAAVAEASGWAKRDVYARAVALKDGER